MLFGKTNKPDGIFRYALLPLTALLCPLAGCGLQAAPPCPIQTSQTSAPSGGCLAVLDGRLLVVQDLQGRISLPGGAAERGESAQCAAFRETWEETGLQLKPEALVTVFDTGFHLYRCSHGPGAGEPDPPPRLEIQAAFYLAPAEFGDWDWRFPGQRDTLRRLLESESAARPPNP